MHRVHVLALEDVSLDQPFGVFVSSALSELVGCGEVNLHCMRVLNVIEAMDLGAVAQGNGLDWRAQLCDGLGHGRVGLLLVLCRHIFCGLCSRTFGQPR